MFLRGGVLVILGPLGVAQRVGGGRTTPRSCNLFPIYHPGRKFYITKSPNDLHVNHKYILHLHIPEHGCMSFLHVVLQGRLTQTHTHTTTTLSRITFNTPQQLFACELKALHLLIRKLSAWMYLYCPRWYWGADKAHKKHTHTNKVSENPLDGWTAGRDWDTPPTLL